MYVFNQNVSPEFYRAFVELVENSSLNRMDGSITLFTDGASWDSYAAYTSTDSTDPRPLGRASTPKNLFQVALRALEPRSPAANEPSDELRHPGPGRWWWLCFVDTGEPEGQQFRGVAVVEGSTFKEAIERVAALRIYPGGAVASVPCTNFVPASRWRNRLLTRPDVIAARKELGRA
jgi:hypothetical protein